MIWTTLYWVFLGFAGLVALRALLWDRPGRRGRSMLRCRKCWYDLSKSEGLEAVGRDHPVTCPECGRAHVSLLSMSRTRRHPRQLALAVVLLVLAYAAQATPKVQINGWAYAIPDVGLILTMPFLSEEPGSSMSFYDPKYSTSKVQESILDLVSSDHGTGALRNARSYGWFDQRLLFFLAKRESTKVITDSSTAKGNAYKSILSLIARQGDLPESEERWLNNQIYYELDLPEKIPSDRMIYSTIRVRRLKRTPYRLVLGMGEGMLKGYPVPGMTIGSKVNHPRGGISRSEPMTEIEVFQWDSTFMIDASGQLTHDDTIPIGAVWNGGNQHQIISPITLLENTGGRFGEERWEQVGNSSLRVDVEIDPEDQVRVNDTLTMRDELESRISARLIVEYSRQQERWVPVIQFKPKSRTYFLGSEQRVFGGELEVYFKPDPSETSSPSRGSLLPVLKSEPHVWGVEPHRLIKGRGIKPVPTPSELKYTGYMRPSQTGVAGTYFVRVEPLRVGRYYNLGGFEADVFYTGELEFEIPNWTPQEMTQFVVNGIAPEHAMD